MKDLHLRLAVSLKLQVSDITSQCKYLEINDSDECRRTKTSRDRFNHFLDYFVKELKKLVSNWSMGFNLIPFNNSPHIFIIYIRSKCLILENYFRKLK